jgi:hypothetical protein
MIARADKGNSIVILPTTQYDKDSRLHSNNSFQITKKDPTNNFQSQVRKSINNNKTLIPQDTKWRYTNMNPSAPTIKGLIKIHKPEQPIRPIVNWRNAPAYKLASLLTHKIKHLAPPPYTYNVNNTTDLINELRNTQTYPHYGSASLDISNLYMNIPVTETRDIIANTLEHLQTRTELLEWYDVITRQNYFSNNGEILI